MSHFIRYRFRSSSNWEIFRFDGSAISFVDFKEALITQKGLGKLKQQSEKRRMDFDLVCYNEQTRQRYQGFDAVIPHNTNVIVCRVYQSPVFHKGKSPDEHSHARYHGPKHVRSSLDENDLAINKNTRLYLASHTSFQLPPQPQPQPQPLPQPLQPRSTPQPIQASPSSLVREHKSDSDSDSEFDFLLEKESKSVGGLRIDGPRDKSNHPRRAWQHPQSRIRFTPYSRDSGLDHQVKNTVIPSQPVQPFSASKTNLGPTVKPIVVPQASSSMEVCQRCHMFPISPVVTACCKSRFCLDCLRDPFAVNGRVTCPNCHSSSPQPSPLVLAN